MKTKSKQKRLTKGDKLFHELIYIGKYTILFFIACLITLGGYVLKFTQHPNVLELWLFCVVGIFLIGFFLYGILSWKFPLLYALPNILLLTVIGGVNYLELSFSLLCIIITLRFIEIFADIKFKLIVEKNKHPKLKSTKPTRRLNKQK